jgi:hypothetical protein
MTADDAALQPEQLLLAVKRTNRDECNFIRPGFGAKFASGFCPRHFVRPARREPASGDSRPCFELSRWAISNLLLNLIMQITTVDSNF